ncbi:MAG: hypothetical protein F4Z18_10345, partial [Caldilineaceae bacterium SB0666_bin_21]|nr:hypothetical protein [Caldilineaceae bacterium SB0666_bin_21]
MPDQQASPPSWDREVSFSNHPCKALPEQVRPALVAVRHDQNIDFLGFMLADYLFVDPDQRQTPPTDYDPAISGETTVDVTERCVLQLEADGWIVTEITPGVDFDRDVQARCGFRL